MHVLVLTREKYVHCGAFVNAAVIFTSVKDASHSNLARHGILICETLRSHTGVDEDYALSTGEG